MLILIVDDHPATVTFMRMAFVSAGHTVTTATSVDGAISAAVADPPDVVLTDLTFSNGGGNPSGQQHDGCFLARTLRSMPDNAAVGMLAVSGTDVHDVVSETVDSGFDGFVSKPVDLASLLECVDQLGELVAARR